MTTNQAVHVGPSPQAAEDFKKAVFAVVVSMNGRLPPQEWAQLCNGIGAAASQYLPRPLPPPPAAVLAPELYSSVSPALPRAHNPSDLTTSTSPTPVAAKAAALTPETYSSGSAALSPEIAPSNLTTAVDGTTTSKVPALTEEAQFQMRKLDFLAEVATATLENRDKPESDNTMKKRLESFLDSEGIDVPSPNDVIFGKGGRLKHPGNETFRAECQRLAPRFLENPTSTVKHEVAQQLVRFVYERGGQFLVENREHKGKWKQAGFDLACKKARQLLADAKKKSASSCALQQQNAKPDNI